MCASARRGARAEQLRRLPKSFQTDDSVSRKIMRANEKRIMVENLGAGRLIVGIIEAHEGVSQKRSELAAGFRQLFGRTRRLNYLRQVRAHLQFRMTVIVNSCGPLISFAISENWLGHLEFPEFPAKGSKVLPDK